MLYFPDISIYFCRFFQLVVCAFFCSGCAAAAAAAATGVNLVRGAWLVMYVRVHGSIGTASFDIRAVLL